MEPTYISMKEAATRLHVTSATLYYYIRRLNLTTHKFPLDKRAYLLASDVERIETLKAQANARREEDEEGDHASAHLIRSGV